MKEGSHKEENLLEQYREEQQQYLQLWKIFSRNSLKPDFQRSFYSALSMLIIPTTLNIYFIFKNPLLKNTIRLTVMISSMMVFQYYLNRDFEIFLQRDSKDSNEARSIVQKISYNNIIFPWFEKETLDILQLRDKKETK